MPRSLSALATNNSRPTHPLQDVLGALCRLDDDDDGNGGVDDDGGHIPFLRWPPTKARPPAH